MKNFVALAGRVLIASIFILSGIHKMMDPVGTQGYMTSVGIPMAGVMIWIAAGAELAGGASLLFGFKTRIGAAGLFLFLIPTTWIFHTNFSDPMQMINFLKNLAIMGGLLTVSVSGPGAWSCDARCKTGTPS